MGVVLDIFVSGCFVAAIVAAAPLVADDRSEKTRFSSAPTVVGWGRHLGFPMARAPDVLLESSALTDGPGPDRHPVAPRLLGAMERLVGKLQQR